MAQLAVFGYRYRPTPAHATDARVKLLVLVSVSIATLHAGAMGLMLASAMTMLLLHQVRVPVRQVFLELRWFLLLMCFVWGVRCLNTPGEPLVTCSGIEVTRQGAMAGAMICWRWLLIVCLGLCLSASTKTAEISAAVQWGLQPLLGKSVHHVGLMIGLMMRCISLVLTQTKEIADAQRSRAIGNRKNPIYRMKMTVMPLMRRSFLSADRMATAIASRCYGERRTPHPWQLKRGDVIVLSFTFMLCAAIILA